MELLALSDRGTSDAFSRRFGLTAQATLSLAPEIMPVASLGDMPELMYHGGWRRWMCGGQIAAIAAQSGRVQLRVVDTSTALVVVEQVILSVAADAEFLSDYGYGPGATDLATTFASFDFRDARQRPSAGTGNVIISGTTSAAVLTPVGMQITRLSRTPLEVPGMPMVLVAGAQLLYGVSPQNSALDFTFVWRERRLQDQENVP